MRQKGTQRMSNDDELDANFLCKKKRISDEKNVSIKFELKIERILNQASTRRQRW